MDWVGRIFNCIGPDKKHRNSPLADHLLGNTSKYIIPQPAIPVGTKNNQIGVQFLGVAADRLSHTHLLHFVNILQYGYLRGRQLPGYPIQICSGFGNFPQVVLTMNFIGRIFFDNVKKDKGCLKPFGQIAGGW